MLSAVFSLFRLTNQRTKSMFSNGRVFREKGAAERCLDVMDEMKTLTVEKLRTISK